LQEPPGYYLTETLLIEGVKYKLIDTAGIRESEDTIESEGIKRTKKKLKDSFYSILLINPFEIVEGFAELMEQQFDLMLFTHADLPDFEAEKAKLVSLYPSLGSIGAVDLRNPSRDWEVELLKLINKKYLKEVSSKPILLDRHKHLILQASQVLTNYQQLSTEESDVAILSQELNAMGHCISELIGIVSPDQILNSIFSNFCIGK